MKRGEAGNGPRHWAWFKTTVADYFSQMRAREEAADPMGLYRGVA